MTHPQPQRHPVALLALAAIAAAWVGCSGAPPRVVQFKAPKTDTDAVRYAKALRLAAEGRVQARAGLEADAAETLRRSYGLVPDVGVLRDHAEAAERAGSLGQAHAAWLEVLRHPLTPAARKRAQANVERLATQVPADHAPVLIQVSPDHARVVLERADDKTQRLMLSDGVVWLKAGTWQAASSADGYKSELRGFRVRRRGAQTVVVSLERGAGAPRIAGLRPAPKQTASVAPPNARDPSAKDPSGKDPDAKDPNAKDPNAKDPSAKDPTALAGVTPPGDPGPGTGESPGPGEGDPGEGQGLAGADPSAGEQPGVTKPQPSGRRGLHKWGPMATAGLGVVALGVGGYLGFNATQWADQANALSPTRSDYKSQLTFYGDGATVRAKAATGLFVAGGLLAAAGTAWWLFAPRASRVADAHPLAPSGLLFTGQSWSALWRF